MSRIRRMCRGVGDLDLTFQILEACIQLRNISFSLAEPRLQGLELGALILKLSTLIL